MTKDDVETLEKSLVQELRRRMKGHMTQELYEDDHIFIRFLRARNHNLDAAENMLKNHINWRKEYNVDTMLTDYIPQQFLTTEYATLSTLGNDLEGYPTLYIHIAHLDTRGLLKTVKKKEIQKYMIYYLETTRASMKTYNNQTGKFVDKWNIIFNFEGFSLMAATHKQILEFYLEVVSLYEGNFPETLKTAYAINASYYFTLAWAVVRPFLSAATMKKVQIFGKTGWKEELMNNISPDILPEFLGGNRTDPDGNPMCKSIIRYGGEIPETYYEYANQTCAARLPGAKKLSISRMSRAEVTLDVLHPGSTLEWEFVLKNRDIRFSVLHREHNDSDTREVIPQHRVQTSESTESGMCQCEKAGIYIIVFDNTYSWVHGKELHYTASVVKPDTQVTPAEITRMRSI